MKLTTHPNCKINLGLHVLGRRADGYHDLATIFLPVADMTDELEVESAVEVRMVQTGLALDNAPADNICLRAWQVMHDEYGIPPVEIRLTKRIPFGAGLGGGSADAAFTLRMLNEMFALGLDDARLERYAARLGADCAFFVKNRPAYATGIGDQLEELELRIPNFEIKIEIPEGEHVSTKEAYAGIDNSTFLIPHSSLKEAVRRPIEEWRDFIVNDFEASVFPAHPAIAALKEDMYRRGALYASMTGSGAAVFGIFAK
jgi:4-diphosphocytidyl-2-C-methyl-D-erythritol kinase